MNMISIKIKKLHPNAVIPVKMTTGAACMDLVATEIIQEDEDKVTVKFGFSTAIPIEYKICIAPRSSFTNKGWMLINSPAQIDSDYRGEWMLKFDAIPVSINSYWDNLIDTANQKLEYPRFPYKIGDRVAQCWIEKVIDSTFLEVKELDSTERGEGGFGSTNR